MEGNHGPMLYNLSPGFLHTKSFPFFLGLISTSSIVSFLSHQYFEKTLPIVMVATTVWAMKIRKKPTGLPAISCEFHPCCHFWTFRKPQTEGDGVVLSQAQEGECHLECD